MMYSIIFIVLMYVKSISLQVTVPTVNLCFARVPDSNCAYIKQCNSSTGDLAHPVTGLLPCLEASGDGLITIVNTPPFLVLNFDLTKLRAFPENSAGYCECSVCSQQCGNVFTTDTRCNQNSSRKQNNLPSLSDSMSLLESTIPLSSSGSGGLCVSTSNTPSCLVIVFCNVIVDVGGMPMRLVDLLPVCFDVRSADLLGPGTLSITLPMSSNQTECPCRACAAACAVNPLLGCPNGYNNSTPCPSTTQCPRRTTTSATCV